MNMMELSTPPSGSYKAGNVDSKSSSSPATSRAHPSQPPSPGLSGTGFQDTPRCQCGFQESKETSDLLQVVLLPSQSQVSAMGPSPLVPQPGPSRAEWSPCPMPATMATGPTVHSAGLALPRALPIRYLLNTEATQGARDCDYHLPFYRGGNRNTEVQGLGSQHPGQSQVQV